MGGYRFNAPSKKHIFKASIEHGFCGFYGFTRINHKKIRLIRLIRSIRVELSSHIEWHKVGWHKVDTSLTKSATLVQSYSTTSAPTEGLSSHILSSSVICGHSIPSSIFTSLYQYFCQGFPFTGFAYRNNMQNPLLHFSLMADLCFKLHCLANSFGSLMPRFALHFITLVSLAKTTIITLSCRYCI